MTIYKAIQKIGAPQGKSLNYKKTLQEEEAQIQSV